MSPLAQAFEFYNSLINDLADEFSDRNFGGIADPLFGGCRFYSFDHLSHLRGSFDYDRAAEVGAEKVDVIEGYLLQADQEYSLFSHILARLRTVAPSFNSNGKTVFLGFWGAGPGEIGWSVRYLNNPETFENFLNAVSLSEADVDVYNDACLEEIRRAERGAV